ncbi:transcriptional regulator, AraC family [Novosphingobium mathurense]|uniref:Transcriptional regulator, AraC family n=2 Tax=Novosphingobium mathurense TaxID=428990 RepID=A0A1U6IJ26_9SPHN|nr:transcriptional regulator, AraC family [Novosphingobium mathurense]
MDSGCSARSVRVAIEEAGVALPARTSLARPAFRRPNPPPGWTDLIGDHLVRVDLSTRGSAFKGDVEINPVSRTHIARIAADAEYARRTKQHICSETEEFFLLNIMLGGRPSYSQFGRDIVVDRGHFTLLHTGSPYEFEHSDPMELLCLKIPSSVLLSRVRDPYAFCGTSKLIGGSISRMTRDLMVSLSREIRGLPNDARGMVEDNLLDMVGMMMDQHSSRTIVNGTSARWALHRRAVRYIQENIGDPDMNPCAIAKSLRVSVRHLHRAFEAADQSVHGTHLAMRLEASRKTLADASLKPLSIKEVAHRCGFRSQSHFSSLFRSRFGMTPKQFRTKSIECLQVTPPEPPSLLPDMRQ